MRAWSEWMEVWIGEWKSLGRMEIGFELDWIQNMDLSMTVAFRVH